jgi:hypothetical protein
LDSEKTFDMDNNETKAGQQTHETAPFFVAVVPTSSAMGRVPAVGCSSKYS